MLKLIDVTLKLGGETLFAGLDVTVHDGHRVGIVGRNGIGKSTLFALVRRALLPDEGDVVSPPKWTVAHLAQEVEASDRQALDWVLDGDQQLRQVEQRIADAESADDNHALAHLYTDLEDAGGYTAAARAAEILNGLGFAADTFSQRYAEFSGGWRIRLNLAQTLMSPSDLLLLDEPTNHLDLDAMFWLESWLLSYPGTLLVIAHDRDFLDTVCTDIVHLEHNQARSYKGNYSSFERQRAETLALQASVHKKQQQQAAHLQQFIDRFRSKATKARQVQGRIKALERLTAAAPAHADSPYTFSFPNPLKMSNPLLTLRDGALGYAGQSVLREVRLDVHPAARIGVLGANGAGKSTLMKTLANELAPIAGDLQRGAHSAIGYFAQQQLEQLNGSRSPLALLEETALLQGKQGEQTEQQRRNYLGRWGFIGDMVKRPCETLSGGERARLVLALIAWQRPALLILDEPTNHLDLEMRHALSIALQDYTGAMILVSHDRELLARTVDEYWLVAHGQVREFKGDLDAYRDLVQSRLAHPDNLDDRNDETKKGRRRAAAERRRESEPLRKRIKQLDAQIRTLNDSLAELDTTLADVGAYERLSGDELNQLLAAQGEQRRDLESAEQTWLELHEALESVTNEARV